MKLIKILVLTAPTTKNVESRFSVFNSLPPGNHGVDKEKLPFQKIDVPKKSLDTALLFYNGFDRRSLLEVFEKFTQNTVFENFFSAIHLICFVRFLKEYSSTCCDCG